MKQLIILLFSNFIAFSAIANISYKISKEWNTDANVVLELATSRQQFTIETWEKNTVHFEYELASDDASVKREDLKEMLVFNYDNNQNKIDINTAIIKKNKSIWSWIFGSRNDASKIISKGIIYIPKSMAKLILNLSYTKIKINPIQTDLKVSASYSEINLLENNNKNKVNLSYSDFNVGNIDQLDCTASYSDVKINSSNTIDISTSYCDIELVNCNQLTSAKLSYSNLIINTINSITTNASYSDIKIGNVIQLFTANLSYSDIKINNISNKINAMKLIGTYSDFAITIPPDLSAFISLKGNNHTMKYLNKSLIATSASNNYMKTKTATTNSPVIEIIGTRCTTVLY